jgi:DNA-binding beta-propeller fold protein YncE
MGLIAILALLVTALSVTSALAIGRWRNGLPATLVLGQANFFSGDPNRSGTTDEQGMYMPMHIAVDPTTGKLFVADSINHRVLRYADPLTMANGAAAEAVLGQDDFYAHWSGTTANRMNVPRGVFVDNSGTLWVGDIDNNRVLRFDNASSKANGANADGVLGQPDFTSGTPATTQSGMASPIGVFVDDSGRLWVAEQANARVTRFDNAAAKANGANADGVLGQPDFTSNTFNTTQSGMSGPTAVWVSSGTLFVGDNENYRVLRFDNAAAKANGANADGVLGQPDFTTNNWQDCDQTSFGGAYGVTVDASGTLYVADSGNHRVLLFNNAASLADGAEANNVLGQTSFTTCNYDLSATRLHSPYGVFVDDVQGVLWVGDGNNNRVLRYQADCTAIATGNWDQASTWNCARVPGDGFNVTIPVTWTVTLNTDTADLFHVSLNGTLQNDGASHSLNLSGDWANGGTFLPGVWIGVNFDAGDLQYLSGPTTFFNLSTTSGTTLDVGSTAVVAAGTVDNAGEIRRLAPAQNVTLGSDFTFKDGAGQDSVVIHQTGGTAMGLTTAQINAHPPTTDFACGADMLTTPAVLRYFEITPTNGVSVTADLTLAYYDGGSNSEANTLDVADLVFSHCVGGSWTAVPGTYTHWTTGDYRFVKLSGHTFSSFSPFALARVSHDPDLVDLAPSSGMLDPWFASDLTSYTDTVSNTVHFFSLTPVAADAGATIKVNGEPVQSGNPSPQIFLHVGVNLITTTVTAEDGVITKDYFVTVIRQPRDPNAPLISDWQNGMAASLVLGQADFTSWAANRGGSTSALGFDTPYHMAIDPVSGKLFVSDYDNNRVLRFANAASLTDGAPAEAVLGQDDFSGSTGGTAANRMYGPGSIHIDQNGTLWVSDYDNNRVLRFDSASAKANGADADGVLGQPDFISSSIDTTQSTMDSPDGVHVDTDGTLWVADSDNNRVLRFDNAAAKANGADADGVLGQPDFTSWSGNTTEDGMWQPTGVWVSNGALFVGERDNYRVVRFDNAAAKPNGAPADGVLGQPDFETADTACSQSGLDSFYYLSVDGAGSLYVADEYNHRVLIWDDAASLENGANASHVLGQTSFTSCDGDTTASKFYYPGGVFASPDGQSAWVADTDNNRVLRIQKECTAVASGNWDQPSTWDCGRVPGDDDSVTIPVTWTVTLNTDVTDLLNLRIDGALVHDGSPHTLTLTGDWTKTGSFDAGTWIKVKFDARDVQYLHGVTFFYDLEVTTGTALDVGGLTLPVDGTLTNAGEIRRLAPAQNIALGSDFTFKDGAGQDSVVIHQTGGAAMGLTTAQINAHPITTDFACGANTLTDPAVRRYFDITPANGANVTADLTLAYYDGARDSEANATTPANLSFAHCENGSWVSLPGTYTHGVNGDYRFVKLSGHTFSSFSPFALVESSNSNDASLSGLAPAFGLLTPAFQAETLDYTDIVSYTVDGLVITPTAGEAHATLQARVNGGSWIPLASGSPSGPLPLNVGDNTVEVKVTAQDTLTTRTYTLTVTRADRSELVGLVSSVGSLAPVFNPLTRFYNLPLPGGTKTITLTLYPGLGIAEIGVRINDGNWIHITPGIPSPPLVVHGGDNRIKIMVTDPAQVRGAAAALASTTYTVRADSPDTNVFFLPHLLIPATAR